MGAFLDRRAPDDALTPQNSSRTEGQDWPRWGSRASFGDMQARG
jgi:hypothetical protein